MRAACRGKADEEELLGELEELEVEELGHKGRVKEGDGARVRRRLLFEQQGLTAYAKQGRTEHDHANGV